MTRKLIRVHSEIGLDLYLNIQVQFQNGHVLLGSTNINLEQMKAGCAWYFKRNTADVPEIRRVQYKMTETEARDKRIEAESLAAAAGNSAEPEGQDISGGVGGSSKQFISLLRVGLSLGPAVNPAS